MAEFLIPGWRCERCGHKWVPRKPREPPDVCPKCKSPYWDRPRQPKGKGKGKGKNKP